MAKAVAFDNALDFVSDVPWSTRSAPAQLLEPWRVNEHENTFRR